MQWSLLPSLCLFGLVIAITPGPNNFLLTSSGATFGLRRTLPHIIGIRIGISGLLLLCAAGISALIEHYPFLHNGLRYIGVAYMSYLALKLIYAGGRLSQSHATNPFNWQQAAMFQMANVKAWAACISVVASYTLTSHYWLSVLWIILAFTVTGLIANLSWACLGQATSVYLNTPNKIRLFNYILSFLTIATIVPVLFETNTIG